MDFTPTLFMESVAEQFFPTNFDEPRKLDSNFGASFAFIQDTRRSLRVVITFLPNGNILAVVSENLYEPLNLSVLLNRNYTLARLVFLVGNPGIWGETNRQLSLSQYETLMNVLAARKRDEQFTLTLPNMSSFRFPELKERLELFPLDTQISSVHIIQQCEFNKDEMNEYTREKVFEATCKFKEILMLYDWTNFQQFANLCLQERAEIIQVDFGYSINETNLASLFTNLWSLFQSTEISFSITIKSFLCIEETLWDRLNQLPHYDTEGYIRGRRYKIRVFEVDHPTLGDQFKMAFTVNLDRKEHGMYCTERVVFE